MARRKHHKRRHRRVGAMGLGKGGNGMKLLAVAGGFFLGDTINAQIDKFLPKTTETGTTVQTPNQTIGIVGEIGLGGLLLMRKRSNMIMTIGGGVLAGAGLKRLAKKMGILSGYQNVPVIGRHRMTGYQSVPVIGGRPAQLQGTRTPSQLQGFKVNGYASQGSGALMGGCGSGLSGTTGYMQ